MNSSLNCRLRPKLKPEFGNSYETGLKSQLEILEGSLTLYSFDLRNTIVNLTARAQTTSPTQAVHCKMVLNFCCCTMPENSFSGWVIIRSIIIDSKNTNAMNKTSPKPRDWSAHSFLLPDSISEKKNWYANFTAQHVSKISLNDANTVKADAYALLGLRAGIKVLTGKAPIELFCGADNLLDTKYSLGNDINVAAPFKNASLSFYRFIIQPPARNFYFGLVVALAHRR